MNEAELVLFETERFTASQARGYRLPGYVLVESKADVRALDAFADDARDELARCLADAERIVRALTDPERVYTLRFGEVQPRVHFHVVPRTARVGAAFTAATGDEPPFDGAKLVSWLWGAHAELGFTDDELRAFVAAARGLHAG